MIRIFRKCVLKKSFIIWALIFIVILFFAGNLLLNVKQDYLYNNDIKDETYLLYTLLFPMSFYEESIFFCIIIDVCYLAIISYVLLSFVDYFFNKNTTATFTKIDRDDWFKEIMLFSNAVSLIIVLIYIFISFLLVIKGGFNFDFSINLIMAIAIKIILTLLMPSIYLLTFINTNNEFCSFIIYIMTYILAQIIIKTFFNELLIKFNYYYLIIAVLVALFLLIRYLNIHTFRKRDLG